MITYWVSGTVLSTGLYSERFASKELMFLADILHTYFAGKVFGDIAIL